MSLLKYFTASGRMEVREQKTRKLIVQFLNNNLYSERQTLALEIARLATEKGIDVLLTFGQEEVAKGDDVNALAIVVRAFSSYPNPRVIDILQAILKRCVETVQQTKVTPEVKRVLQQGSGVENIANNMLLSSMGVGDDNTDAYRILLRSGSFLELSKETKVAISKCGGIPQNS